jgi:hypothetical protein
MRVADLIALLQQENPTAMVVLWDRDVCDSLRVAKLGYGEVQPIELGTWESNGLLVLEVWGNGVEQDGPFPGVVLGGN